MASHTISGTARDPGSALGVGDKYRFTHMSNTGDTVKGAQQEITVAPDGTYSINLQYGNIMVETYDVHSKVYTRHQIVTVNQDTTASNLPDLLGAAVPPTDDQLLQFQALLADTRAARDEAIAAKDVAIVAKDESIAAAQTSVGVEDLSGGNNKVIYDDQGNKNIMVRVPVFNLEDINAQILAVHGVDMQLGTGVHPAFLTGGTLRKQIWIAKYLASAGVGSTCSVVPNVQPSTSVNYDTAKSRCTSKGTGWHLMSGHEWAAVCLWSLANDTVPRGNTYHGQAYDNKLETAIRSDSLAPGDTGGTGRTNTGSGPVTWNHNHNALGICDLVGNVWEWIDQLKLQDGQLITTPDNQPDLAENQWSAQPAYLDSVNDITLSEQVTVRDGTIGDNANSGTSRSKMIADVGKSAGYTPNALLRQLLIEFAAKPRDVGRLYMRNYGERLPARGDIWSASSYAGVGALSFYGSRAYAYNGLGFRPAFFE